VKFTAAERHLRRLAKVSAIRTNTIATARISTISFTSEASVARAMTSPNNRRY
jgi:hypothetical protein